MSAEAIFAVTMAEARASWEELAAEAQAAALSELERRLAADADEDKREALTAQFEQLQALSQAAMAGESETWQQLAVSAHCGALPASSTVSPSP